MSNSPTVSYPRKATDPVKQAREKLEAQRTLASTPFTAQVRQQMTLLEAEVTRLEEQLKTLTQTCQDRRYQLQHLSAYLAVAVQEQKEG